MKRRSEDINTYVSLLTLFRVTTDIVGVGMAQLPKVLPTVGNLISVFARVIERDRYVKVERIRSKLR